MKKGQNTRERLIDAMAQALRIYGYHGTSLSRLLKETGIPKGSMYHYFSSKKELVLCVIDERLKPRIEDHLLFALRSGRSPLDAIIERVEELKSADRLLKERFLLMPLLIETSGVEPQIHEAVQKLYDLIFNSLKKVLDEAEGSGDIHPIDSEALSHFLLTLLLGSLSLSPSTLQKAGYVKNLTLMQEYLRSLKVSKKERPKHIQQTLF
ncbi:MAG: hypothetical protein B6D59_02195 [Campylobacteraceae bacterium 4484_4]|nr:MAG: hypothetical protein B6D59_02195 [Campylobacteraceae bacterium 4484_4]